MQNPAQEQTTHPKVSSDAIHTMGEWHRNVSMLPCASLPFALSPTVKLKHHSALVVLALLGVGFALA